jgi:hypothetical protein
MSLPKMKAVPLVGVSSPDNIDKVVVFPAPFVPRKPKHSPAWTEKVKDCTATFGP